MALPLLQTETVQTGWVDNNSFLAGYGAVLYTPLWTSTIHTPSDFGLALVDFVLMMVWKVPSWVIVIISAGGAALSAVLRLMG